MENVSLSQRKQRYTAIAQARNERLGTDVSFNKKSLPVVPIVVGGIVVIIILGVLWISNMNKGREEPDKETEEQQEYVEEEEILESEAVEEIEEVDVSEKSIDSSAENAPTDSDFSTDAQSVGDEAVTEAVLGKMEQKGYEGFMRITFNLDSEGGVPLTSATLESGANMIKLKIAGLSDDKSGIGVGSEAKVSGSVVSTIIHNVTSEANTSYYSIGIKEDTSFYLHSVSSPDRIILDIKEQEVTNGDDQEFSFSKDKQNITGDAEGNAIVMDGISHQDLSGEGVFRITYRIKSVGTGNIPAVLAELVDYDGGKAVKVVISNMKSDFAASGNYDETYNSVGGVIGMRGSFAANVSTYYIKLTSAKDYKLYYTQAPAQVILDIKR
ncbi:hypothetical protein JW766_01935 [Candidatus Dojkabacteria bacterium]|nr:hypothetical protein [Candidatus Dojkabacteria bacterium]